MTPELTVTVGRRAAIRAALLILWTVALAGSRRDATITFVVGGDR